MPDPLNLLNNVGIQNVLAPQENVHMPEAKPMPMTSLHKVGVEELFHTGTTSEFLENALAPNIGDGSVVEPFTFNANLEGAYTSLKDVDVSEVKTFVQEELHPLLENKALLQAYSGLLIGG